MIHKLTAHSAAKALLTIAAVFLLWSSFYSFGIILILFLSLKHLPKTKVFSTILSKFILSVLILCALTMVLGFATWALKVPLHPAMTVFAYILLIAVLNVSTKGKCTNNSKRFMDRTDIVAMLVALVLPFILYASFQLPHFTNAASYQIMTNGPDNVAHLLMLETASVEKGYVYGSLSDVIPKTVLNMNAYPQAWHLATAQLSNGFGTNLFNAKEPLRSMNFYLLILTLWSILCNYLFVRTVISILKKIGPAQQRLSPSMVAIIAISSLLFQVLSTTEAWLTGYASMLGFMTYAIGLVSLIIDTDFKHKDNSTAIYYLILLMAVSSILCWFLPLPAIVITLIALLMKFKHKSIGQLIKHHLRLVIALLASISTSLVPIILFVAFSTKSASDQVTSDGGVIANSGIMVVILLLLSLHYLRKYNKDMLAKAVSIFVPFVILLLSVAAFQYMYDGEVSYYYYKLMEVLLMLVCLFAIPVITLLMIRIHNHYGHKLITTVLLTVSGLGILVIGSGQTLKPLQLILQKNSRNDYKLSQEVVTSVEPGKINDKVIIINGDKHQERGRVAQAMTLMKHQDISCVYIVGIRRVSTNNKFKELEQCLSNSSNAEEFTIITSSDTYNEAMRLKKKYHNINIIE